MRKKHLGKPPINVIPSMFIVVSFVVRRVGRLAAQDIISYCCVFRLSYDPPTRLIVVCVKQVSAETETGEVVLVTAAEEPKCCFVGRLVSKSTGKARELAKPTKNSVMAGFDNLQH